MYNEYELIHLIYLNHIRVMRHKKQTFGNNDCSEDEIKQIT